MTRKNYKFVLLVLLPIYLLVITTCKQLEKTMLVSTGDISSISTNYAEVAGAVVDIGEGATQHGHCYGVSPNLSISGTKTELGVPPSTGGFTSQLTGLLAGTVYYVKAYISDGTETVYGKEINFTTNKASLPGITTTSISSVTRTTATSGGNITSDGGSPVTARGVCWNTSADPSISNSKTTDGTGTGTFSSNLDNLTSGTVYYVRAYATNSEGTSYGEQLQFSTEALSLPALTTAAVTNITETSAIGEGTISDNGGSPVTVSGVCWSTTNNPDIADSHSTDGTSLGTFTSSINGLTPNTTYYVRAYATTIAGTGYGNEVSFTTSAEVIVVVPSLTTTTVTAIFSTSATGGGNIASNGGGLVTISGVCWSTTNDPDISGNHSTDGSTSGTFTSSITGLMPSTTYYVRAYATNSAGTGYGNEVSFTSSSVTPVLPTITTSTVTAITQTTAISGGNISSDGGETVSVSGICWGTTTKPVVTGSHTTDGSLTGTFSSTMTGLTANTTYYVRAYATNSAGTAYGTEITFTTTSVTIVVPTLSTAAVTSITQTTATSGGNITNNGGATITASGVCWSTTTGPVATGNHTTDGAGSGTFTSNITGLTAGTKYFVRAYATNSAGTAYGDELSFTTSTVVSTPPTAAVAAATLITNTTATINGAVNANGHSTAVTFEYGLTVLYGSVIDAVPSSLTGSGTTNVNASLIGLSPGTIYHYRIKAVSTEGTSYSNDISFTTLQTPIAVTESASSITNNGVTLNGTVNPTNLSTNVTFEYGTSIAYGFTVTATPNPIAGGNPTSVSASVLALSPGALYHFRVKAVSTGGTVYGDDVTFTTLCIAPSTTTDAATSLSNTAATLNGSVNANGFSTVVTFEYGINTSYGNTISAIPGPVTGSISTPVSAELTSLAPNITYHFRTKAINCEGTPIYGNDQQFTTPCTAPAASTNAATAVTESGATLNGTTNANGFSTVVTFEYGLTTGYGNSITASQSPVTGSIDTPVSATLTSLSPNITYHFRVKAINCEGNFIYGNDQQFTTQCIAPTAITEGASIISTTKATLNGTVNANSLSTSVTFEFGTTTAYGSTVTATQSPVVSSGNVAVDVGITGLISNSIYHYRLMAVNCGGTIYGDDMLFTTLVSLSTTAISGITTTTCSSGGTVNIGGGISISSRGVCWSTSTGPTIADSKTVDGSGTGTFTSSITGLTPNSTYYVRAYATNIYGTSYGNEQSFTTLCMAPTATTSPAVILSDNSVRLVGVVNAKNSATTVTFEYGTTQSYGATATATQSPVSGTTNTTVSVEIGGLLTGRYFYYRVKAVNCGGTTNGSEQTFISLLCPSTITINHVAGDVSPVSKLVTYGIGKIPTNPDYKCWITQNLGSDRQALSATDETEASAGWYWQFNRKQGYKHTGTVRTPSTAWIDPIDETGNWTSANDPCLIILGAGWRLPTKTEWTNIDNYGWCTFTSDLKIHYAGFLNNSTGLLYGRNFPGNTGYYWSSTTGFSNTQGWYLNYNTGTVVETAKSYGYSVRCIKD